MTADMESWLGMHYDAGCPNIGTGAAAFQAKWDDNEQCVTQLGGWEAQDMSSTNKCILMTLSKSAVTYSSKSCDGGAKGTNKYKVACQQEFCTIGGTFKTGFELVPN